MNTTAELNRIAELYNADLVAVLLAEEGDCAEFLSLLDWSVAELFEFDVLSDSLVNLALNLAKLFVCNLLEVREVEAQSLWRNV